MTDIPQQVASLAEPYAASLGLAVWGVERAGAVVRVYVERAATEAGAGSDASAASLAASGAPGAETGAGGCPREEAKEAAKEGVPSQAGVSIDACADLSRLLGAALDVEDFIPGSYVLEVSSPGFERPFFTPAQLAPYIGAVLDVTTRAPIAGHGQRRHFRGVLIGAPAGADGTVRLRLDGHAGGEPEEAAIAWPDIARAHLVPVFSMPQKPGKTGAARKGAAKPPRAH